MKESIVTRLKTMEEFSASYFQNNITFKIISDEILTAPEPASVESATEILNKCISAYEDKLLLKLNSKPYTDIRFILENTKNSDKESISSPVSELLKTFNYDDMLELAKLTGERAPDKYYIQRLKNGGHFQYRLTKLYSWLNAFELSPEGMYVFSNPKYELSILDVGTYLFGYTSLIKISSFIHKDSSEISRLLEDHAAEYVSLTARFALLQNYKMTPKTFSMSLLYIISTLQFDLMQMSGLICTDEFVKHMTKIQASSNRKKGWKSLDAHYEVAITTANQRWSNGDQRLHHEMALELLEEINEPIRDNIMEELLKKHTPRKTDEEKAAFEKEKNKRFNYETLSFKTLKSKLKPIAIQYNKFHDPGAAHRRNKPNQ